VALDRIPGSYTVAPTVSQIVQAGTVGKPCGAGRVTIASMNG
jgi:hypothetical protein